MTIDTATEITTAARRIARESGAYSLDREDLQFDAEGQIIARPWKSDRTAHDAIIATRKMTQREAQDVLDAHAHAAEADAHAVEHVNAYPGAVYPLAYGEYMSSLIEARGLEAGGYR